MSTDTARVNKLFHLALHPTTPVPEADTAGSLAVKLCRKHGWAIVVAGPTVVPERRQFTPPPERRHHDGAPTIDPKMPFGKYRDRYVSEVTRKDAAYTRWCIDNIVKYDGLITTMKSWLLYHGGRRGRPPTDKQEA